MSELKLRPRCPNIARTFLLERFSDGEEFVYGVPVASGARGFQGAFDCRPGHFGAAHSVWKIDEGFTADDPEFFWIGFYF